jgi:hypothetical protein
VLATGRDTERGSAPADECERVTFLTADLTEEGAGADRRSSAERARSARHTRNPDYVAPQSRVDAIVAPLQSGRFSIVK